MKMKRLRSGEIEGVAEGTAIPLNYTAATALNRPPTEPPPPDPLIVLHGLTEVLARLATVLDRPPVERMVSRKDFAAIIRVSLPVLDRMRAAGKLPRPDMYISRSPRWRADTIRAWIERGGR
jgi:predicted DNA-binding transcriptional regulator AlpA